MGRRRRRERGEEGEEEDGEVERKEPRGNLCLLLMSLSDLPEADCVRDNESRAVHDKSMQSFHCRTVYSTGCGHMSGEAVLGVRWS